MIKLILLTQLVNPYFNPEFGGIFYFKGEKITDSTFKKQELYFEMVIKGAVDPYFIFYGTFPIMLTGVELEEAYVNSLSLPFNLYIGKFKSKFTRLNSLHPHSWDFPELPKLYNFLKFYEENKHEESEEEHIHHHHHGINDIGLGISWISPFDMFWEPGFEVLKGHEGNYDNFIFYHHLSVDLTSSFTLWLSPSIAINKREIVFYGSEFVLKMIEPGKERLKGVLFTTGFFKGEKEKFQGGWIDLVYKFTYGWRIGIRTDLIENNNPSYLFMLDYSPTEYSRFRISYNLKEKKIFFEFNFSVGPHGIHPF